MSGEASVESEPPKTPDFGSLQLDKLTPHSLKSTEEIVKHSVDSFLEERPIDKGIYFCETGDEIQKLSVVHSLADLYRQDPTGCTQRLIPKMQECLPVASSEFHLATSVTIKSLMERKIIPVDTLIQTFLQTIIIGVEHRDPVVADAWVDCLVEVIPHIPITVLRNDILPLAVSKSTVPQPVASRISSCRIIGALCIKLLEHFPNVDAKRDVMPTVLMLCQDLSPDVRAAMSIQLPSVVRLLGSENSKTFLLPAMVDLASDEIPRVKEATFTALVDSIPFFSSDFTGATEALRKHEDILINLSWFHDVIKTVVLPLLMQLMNYAFKYDCNVLLVIAAGYGKMVTGIERVIAQSDKESYFRSYASIVDRCSKPTITTQMKNTLKHPKGSTHATPPGQATSSSLSDENATKCRQFCAFNYPAMAKFVYNEGSKAPIDSLHRYLQEFISDQSPTVRRSIAASLHELVTIYGKYKSLLKPEVCRILRDTDDNVLGGFIHQLGFILVNFKELRYNQNEQNSQDSETLEALMSCEKYLSKSSNWRLHSQFIEQLEVLWYLFPTETVYTHFMAIFFKKLNHHRALPIRLALLRTILVNLKYTPKELYRVDTISSLNEFAASHNFYDRMLYVRMCSIVLDVFSTSFFKQHFLFRLLEMTGDHVANIRWAICKLLPKIHSCLQLPADKDLMTELEARMETLKSDKDNEVVLMINKVKAEITSGGHFNLFPNDQLRYDEEKKVFSLNPKLVQNFPASCAKMFVPSLGGKHLLRKTSDTGSRRKDSVVDEDEERTSTPLPSSRDPSTSGSSRKSPGSRGQVNSESQAGFTDQEFLVDAGITLPLNSFGKLSLTTNNNLDNGTETNGDIPSVVICDTVTEDATADDKINHNDSKASPKKKQIFRHSIPVRKKSNTTEPCLLKNGDEGTNGNAYAAEFEKRFSFQERSIPKKKINSEVLFGKRHSLEVKDSEQSINFRAVNSDKKPQAGDSEKRLSLHVATNSEKNFSYPVVNFEKRRTHQFLNSEKRHSLQLMNAEKRHSIQVIDSDKRHSLELVDINKNVTDKPGPEVPCSNSSVQRRKKSQLPRPLSCVVLPVRNKGLEKTNTSSKLPVMRRT